MPESTPARRRTAAWGSGVAALVAAGVVASVLAAAPTSVQAAPAGAPGAGGLRWAACEPGKPAWDGAECARLRLPVDWARPDGPTFEMEIARRTTTDPARVGTLVFGPGGPGDSGRERVGTGISRFSPEVRRRFDIVSFDPRGVGRSSPVQCSPEKLAARPSPVMKSQNDFAATVAYNKELAADCRDLTGGVHDHLDTAQTVRDLEAIRVALGEGRLTFHGSSYGTILGAQYAETYPGRVRAMVLESVFDHSVPRTREFLETQARAGQDLFDEFVKWCGRDAGCALHGRDVRAVWQGLLDKAGRGEVATPPAADPQGRLGPRLTTSDLVNMVAFRAFYNADFARLADMIVYMETHAPAGTEPPRLSPLPPTVPIFCSDWRLPVRDFREYDALVRRMNGAAPDMPYLLPLRMVAACLGTPAANPQHRLKPTVRRGPPVLLSNGLHDPATPYTFAVSVARQFGPKGVLLTYDGAGHGSATSGPCMENAVDAYLTELTLPARGAHCPAVPS
ncbi:alpha/beta hydrolase [Spirillospora sp. NPDC047279]|uniref:alpha/beta hydrolase n=1 Tax=Spirillospora sp. NPDC047279 TaxID=3155478 RepID=UPI00340CF4C7